MRDLAVCEVADATEAESRVGSYNLERVDSTEELLSRVEREGVLVEADLLVSVAEPVVAVLVLHGLAGSVALDGVGDDAVAPGRDDHHGIGAINDLLVLL